MNARHAVGREPLLTQRFLVVVASGIFYFLALGALLPVVPRYVAERLGGGDIAVGFGVGALAFGAILLRPVAGRLGDRFGRRVLMVTGACAVAVTAVCAGVVASLGWLIATRIVMGLGEACFFVGATAMITDLAPESRRGEAVSYWSVAVWTGLSFGPVLGEVLLADTHYDLVWVVAAGCSAVAAMIALATKETGVAHAERGKLIVRAVVRPGIILAATLIGVSGFAVFIPLYGPEIGVEDVGIVFLVYGLVVLSVRIFAARLPDSLGPVRAASIAVGVCAIGLGVAGFWDSPAGLFSAAVVIALGASMLYPAAMLLALRGVREHERASVIGTFSAFFDFAGGAAGVVLGTVAAFSSYQGAFAVSAVLAGIAFVLLRSGFAGHTTGAVPTVAEVAPATADPTTLP